MRLGLFVLAAGCLLPIGCAVAPGGPHDGSITHDVVDYLHREWPLSGAQSAHCGSCDASACDSKGACPTDQARLYADDWNQPGILPHAKAYTADPPPAVPLAPAGPGRFFPAPTRPAFAPSVANAGGIGPIGGAVR